MQNQIAQSVESDLKDMMEERLDIQASPIMDYQDAIVKKISATKYLYGYLADDDDAINPLEDCDGMGAVHSSHRDSRNHSEMQEALALDSNWEPDYGLAHEHPDVLRRHWVALAAEDEDFQQWCHEEGRPPRDESKLPAYYLNKAKRFWREVGGCTDVIYSVDMDLDDFDVVTEKAEEKAYDELREAGLIGDPDVVVLDCYQHGGVAWSVSGEGMQCAFDTANGAGVWVPDDCTRDEIKRRGEETYAFGSVIELSSFMGPKRMPYQFMLDDQFGGVESIRFKTWHEAYEGLQSYIKANKLRLPKKKSEREMMLERGRRRARFEIARNCVEVYNDFINGNCFGIVIATFEVDENGEPQHVEDDSVWGFIGDEHAMSDLADTMEARDD